MTELKTKVEEVSAIKRKIEVEVPIERVKEALEEEYKKIGKTAKIKGFRKGKVPRPMLEKSYEGEAIQGAMDRLVRETYPEALEKEMAAPISAPYVEPKNFDKENPFVYEATYEIRPVVDLKEYTGLKLEQLETKVSKDEVEQQLETIRQQMTQLEPLPDETLSEKGMVMVVDFKGTADDKSFEGSEANDFMVELGAGNLLPALEKALTGLKKGDNTSFDLTYPEDYFNKELSGKKGHFDVTVKEVKKKITPELTDDFAKDLGEFKTLADVKKDIEKRIGEAKEQNVKRLFFEQVVEQLNEKHPIEIPEAMATAELKNMFQNFVKQLASEGKKFEDTGMTLEQFVENYKPQAENHVRSFLIIDAISEVEKITVDDADLEKHFEDMSRQMGQPAPKVRQQYESKNLIEGLKIQLKHEKTVDFVINKAKIKVVKEKKDKKEAKK